MPQPAPAPPESIRALAPAERLAWGQGVLSLDFHRLMGTELVRWENGSTQLELAITDRLKQQNGFVHGGVLAYLADTAMAFAAGAELGLNVVTGEFKLDYLRPALGERLVARAYVVHAGRSRIVCRADIYVRPHSGAGEEKLCVAAQGTIVPLGDTAQHPL